MPGTAECKQLISIAWGRRCDLPQKPTFDVGSKKNFFLFHHRPALIRLLFKEISPFRPVMTQLAPIPPASQPDSVQSLQKSAKQKNVEQAFREQPLERPIETVVLDVAGMMCAGCVSTVEKKLAQCDGVVSATVNLVTEVAAIAYVADADPKAIAETLTAAGYPSTIRVSQESQRGPLAAEADWLARKEQAQKDQGKQLAIASCLLGLSTLGHLQHFSWAQGLSIPLLGPLLLNTLWFHGLLATLTLLFPARKILSDGFKVSVVALPI